MSVLRINQSRDKVEQNIVKQWRGEEERSLRSWSAGRWSAAVGESVSVVVAVAVRNLRLVAK